MDYGFMLPTRGPLSTTQSIDALASHAEQLGFSHIAVPDHIVIPRAIDSRYPYSDSGAYPGRDGGDCIEQLAVLAYLAAKTSSVRLLSSVMVIPYRNPIFTAKALATIDQLSGGRVTVGVGAGWMEEEFKAVDAPAFNERGRVTDEYIDVFKTLWCDSDPSYSGRFAQVQNITFLPKPVQQPHPPIWVGGESGPALRRTVRCGDAWFPIGANPRHPLNTLARFNAAREKLQSLATAQQRNPATISVRYLANWFEEDKTLQADDGSRHLFTGSDNDVTGDIAAFAELGIDSLLFSFQRDTLEQSLASMEHFAKKLWPAAMG